MKNVQISYELFVKSLLYHLAEDYDDTYGISIILSIKQPKPKKKNKRQGRNIWIRLVCTRILGGKFYANHYDRNVAHSCKHNYEKERRYDEINL